MTREALDDFSAQLRGPIIQPDDPGYDESRAVYNAMHDRRPAMIMRASDAADVGISGWSLRSSSTRFQ
jgi:hypothetical protein